MLRLCRTNIRVHFMSDKKNYLDTVWDQSTLGSMIYALRLCDDISQTNLAEKIGVSRQFMSNVEKNKAAVGIGFLKKLSSALDYPIEPFLELYFKEQLSKEGIKGKVSVDAS